MCKIAAILISLITLFSVYGCANDSDSKFNLPDQQRAHSDKAQGEMSTDTKNK